MNKGISCLTLAFSVLVFFSVDAYSTPPTLVNRIEGQVYGPDRQPVENARVELQNESNSIVGNTKTSSAGRFTFSGMSPGRYNVRVMPLGTNLASQEQEVTVTNITRAASDMVFVQFSLAVDKRVRDSEPEAAPEVVFVQDIPPAARKLFEDGNNDFKEDRVTGLTKLENALEIAPNYYDALDLIAKYYIVQKDYEKAYPYLLKAVDVNPRSFSNYFRLGYVLYQGKQYSAALGAAKASVELLPTSSDAQLLYGTVARIGGSYVEAEKALRAANKIAGGKNAEVHMQLALLFNRLDKNTAAIDELEMYLKLEPKSPDKVKIKELIAKLKASANKPN